MYREDKTKEHERKLKKYFAMKSSKEEDRNTRRDLGLPSQSTDEENNGDDDEDVPPIPMEEFLQEIGDDPHDMSLQEVINKLNKYPFSCLLVSKCFYGKATVTQDMAELQEKNPPASKATLKCQERLRKKERAVQELKMRERKTIEKARNRRNL